MPNLTITTICSDNTEICHCILIPCTWDNMQHYECMYLVDKSLRWAMPIHSASESPEDRWLRGAYVHIFVFCRNNFFWNRLFLQFGNTSIWICAFSKSWIFRRLWSKSNSFIRRMASLGTISKLKPVQTKPTLCNIVQYCSTDRGHCWTMLHDVEWRFYTSLK